jgi:hypothetical protein
MGWWSSVRYEFYQVFLNFSTHKKIKEQKFEKTPFSIGNETYGDVMIREGAAF